MVVASKAAFLEYYLEVSTCILDGSSIEYHKKKRQRFSLSGVRFGRGFKFLERSKMSFPPLIPNLPFGTLKVFLRAESLSRKLFQIRQKA